MHDKVRNVENMCACEVVEISAMDSTWVYLLGQYHRLQESY